MSLVLRYQCEGVVIESAKKRQRLHQPLFHQSVVFNFPYISHDIIVINYFFIIDPFNALKSVFLYM